MRYGLISTVAVILSLGAAGAFAQDTTTGTTSGTAGGTTGGQVQMPPAAGAGGAAQGGTAGTVGEPGGANSPTITGSVDLSPEQRTQVTRMFSGIRTEPVEADFNVTIGATVPATVTTLHTCPSGVADLVSGLPECRYIVVRDQIVLVEPTSRRVVLVLDRQG